MRTTINCHLCDFPVLDQVYWEFKLRGLYSPVIGISSIINMMVLCSTHNISKWKGLKVRMVILMKYSVLERTESELISQHCKRRKNLCKREIIFHSSYLFFCTHFSSTALHLHWWKSSKVTITLTGFIWLGFHLEKLSLPFCGKY